MLLAEPIESTEDLARFAVEADLEYEVAMPEPVRVCVWRCVRARARLRVRSPNLCSARSSDATLALVSAACRVADERSGTQLRASVRECACVCVSVRECACECVSVSVCV